MFLDNLEAPKAPTSSAHCTSGELKNYFVGDLFKSDCTVSLLTMQKQIKYIFKKHV